MKRKLTLEAPRKSPSPELMLRKMPSQHGGLKPRKRKNNSEHKNSRKGSGTRRCLRSPKTQSSAESTSAVCVYSRSDSAEERLSLISCECMLSAGRRRCLASPQLEGQEGKENELRRALAVESCRAERVFDKQEAEDMDCEGPVTNLFPDEDSNQILPVEQFFGNLDAVQDFPQRSSACSAQAQRKNRRRRYYAQEESDEEEVGFSSMQQGDSGGGQ